MFSATETGQVQQEKELAFFPQFQWLIISLDVSNMGSLNVAKTRK